MSDLFAHAQGPMQQYICHASTSWSGLTRCETRHEVRRGIQYNHQSVVKYIPTEYYHTCHTVSRLLVTTVRTHTHTRTHARTHTHSHARTHAHTHRRPLCPLLPPFFSLPPSPTQGALTLVLVLALVLAIYSSSSSSTAATPS